MSAESPITAAETPKFTDLALPETLPVSYTHLTLPTILRV